ncbi:hypothetical protein FA95DRAFT_1495451 [Auriscalpium vulgare]|uniref:Uncharacterized protein n=1 Tax=Auriscalpium vulgare TaxID=40419 RepID=A0ACB8RND5_9AGAM|nr:hypothetical protein FA95DRAFT_1495451 [Auriscalpium vulgare]
MAMLETPSRIWRRIQEEENHDMPSLPSLPAFDDSAEIQESTTTDESHDDANISIPLHSTPVALSHHTTTPALPPSSASSTARFAQSLASRASRSSAFSSSASLKRSTPSTADQQDSFSFDDISAIPSLPGAPRGFAEANMDVSVVVQEEDDLSLADALRSISRAGSPEFEASKKERSYDYSVSLKSEPKVRHLCYTCTRCSCTCLQASPFDKMRNVNVRRPIPRMRTPSLTRTTPSPSSSESNTTPHSNRSFGHMRSPMAALSVPLPPSNNASPAPLNSEEGGHQSPDDLQRNGAYSAQQDEGAEDEDAESGQSEREPTFSSEEAPTPRSNPLSARSPSAPLTAFSSPAASVAFTPTPAFLPRPRARFLPSTPALHVDDPTTPSARRRSFLMDVINSTARPRLANPTPHPLRTIPMETPSSGGSSGKSNDAPMLAETPISARNSEEPETARPLRLQAAFAGITPGPRPRARAAGRLSHPLANAWPAASESESEASPHERASFVSTASSHDLTAPVHARANASFDPVIGLGAGGHGVGRFNAGKLNTYLHGLNRRLQEESETLAGAVGLLREENYGLAEENATLRDELEELQAVARGAGRRGSGGRRVSDIGLTLGNVAEDAGGEGWMEEKAEMEEELEAVKAELERCIREKEDAAGELQEERAARSRDKERWREKMGEVEQGVEGIIHDLEAKLAKAEQRAQNAEQTDSRLKELERAVEELEQEKQFAEARAEKAEKVLESGRELGGELRAANEKLGKTMAELRTAQAHIEDLEHELGQAEEHIANSERDVRAEQERSQKLAQDLEARNTRLDAMEQDLITREQALGQAEEELEGAKTYVAELETDAHAAGEHIDALEGDLELLREQLATAAADEEQTDQDFEHIQAEANRNAELAHQLEEAIDAAEQKIRADEATISELRRTIASLERERERSRSEPSRSRHPDDAADESDAQIRVLEEELDDAYREIGRLNGALAQSPARKAMDRVREAKLEILEKEKEELVVRLQSMRALVGASTPGKNGNISGVSPLHRQVLNMTMKTPKTPGAPLKDMSWLHPTMADGSTSQYLTEIQRLQQELDRANDDIDEKLDRLEQAGFGVVELTQQLDDERARMAVLDDDLARLERREGRRLRRLEKVRCTNCRTKMDLRSLNRAADGDESSLEFSTLNLEPPTPPAKSAESLRTEVQAVNKQLSVMKKQWQDERRQLLGDKAALQDATNRLNAQVRDAEQRAAETERASQKVKSSVQTELEQAKRVIADLEDDLKAERSRLRSITTKQTKAERDKDGILLQLKRTESDMEDVRQQLQRIKKDNNGLEHELRANATAEQKARLLEAKSSQNAETIEHLRQERSLLMADHKKLQQRFREASEQINKLRDEHAASQTSHNTRRHALDLQMLEIEDLKRALSERTDALQATATADKEKERLAADLTRVRRDAEALGRDLKAERRRREEGEAERKRELQKIGRARKEAEEARGQLEKAERARKQASAEARVLRERVDVLEDQRKTARTTQSSDGHGTRRDDSQLVALKAQHKLESKGLVVQIHYLKAKFTRENTLRTGLSYQKRYLLVLLARHERSEEKVLASIARIGFLVPGPAMPRRKTLKSVALSMVFLQRAKRASDAWRAQCAHKPAVRAALEDVRRRRKPAESAHVGRS